VAVTADYGRAWEGEALFWSNDVNDTLSLVAEAKVCQAELFDVCLQRFALCPAVGLVDEGGDVLEVFARRGRNVLPKAISLSTTDTSGSQKPT
jgi:hypothetical protein